MSGAVITIDVDGVPTNDPLGLKEAVVMAIEHLGWATVRRVEIVEPEQMSMAGAAKRPPRPAPAPASPPPRRSDKPPAQARRPRPQTVMECCFTCACYSSGQGRDNTGQHFWGTCGRTGAPVYELKDLCGGWTPVKK